MSENTKNVRLVVDGRELLVPATATVLQACELAHKEIPRFCYHERLSVAGNCRMCLVEVKGAPKPIASCATQVSEAMEITTNSAMTQEARKGVMEFLLINHPLDCPICDQGGECDLQDQALGYGVSGSRFADNKRAVEDKDMGLLVKTIMTRCIHCTRCVRFADEVAGVPALGAIGRGEDMEITNWLEGVFATELSGNVIDLCPVGALTSKPYAFRARPWELTQVPSIDVMDAMGAHIRLDVRGDEVLRILPREAEDINEEWISDKTRFVWDGLRRQRLDTAWVRKKNKLVSTDWKDACKKISKAYAKQKPDSIACLAGDLACVEGMFLAKKLMEHCNSPHLDCRQDGAVYPTHQRGNYLMGQNFAGVQDADALLLVGCNPRYEASVFSARIFQHWRNTALPIGFIGAQADLPYAVQNLGAGTKALQELATGKSDFAKQFAQAKNPMIIAGQSAFLEEGEAVFAQLTALATQYSAGFNMLHNAAARVGGLDIGFVPQKGGKATKEILASAQAGEITMLILLGADEVDISGLKNCFVVYIGSHGSQTAQAADVILPAACYAEKSATYVNSEGRVQMTQPALAPPKDALADWQVISLLAKKCFGNKEFPQDLSALRAELYQAYPHLQELGQTPKLETPDTLPAPSTLPEIAFPAPVADFYLTNAITRASPLLGKCSHKAQQRIAEEKRDA